MNIPKVVAKRIAQRCAEEGAVVVTPDKNGRPARVFSLEKYVAMKKIPHYVQPWKYRRKKSAEADPLGAVNGKVVSSLSRARIYEHEDGEDAE